LTLEMDRFDNDGDIKMDTRLWFYAGSEITALDVITGVQLDCNPY
jgi:hypothetical protein